MLEADAARPVPKLPAATRCLGLDTEITARILRSGKRPFEVPISYRSRSKAQGKKITWRDGAPCLEILVRVRRPSLRDIIGGPRVETTEAAVPAEASYIRVGLDSPKHPRQLRRGRDLLATRGARDKQQGARVSCLTPRVSKGNRCESQPLRSQFSQ